MPVRSACGYNHTEARTKLTLICLRQIRIGQLLLRADGSVPVLGFQRLI
jgi:hypothetical protein